MKPQLAENYDEAKLKFPLIAQPKFDGVRGLNLQGILTGRSLKQFKNKYTTWKFSKPHHLFLDGELAVGSDHRSPSLCRDTTSAVNSIEGEPDVWWLVFDYLAPEALMRPYIERYEMLIQHVARIADPRIMVVPGHQIDSLEDLNKLDSMWLKLGYEGTILRNPNARYKQGRSSQNCEFWRIKRFTDAEAVVLSVIEGRSNENEAMTNELGRTERSTHMENMVPNGMVGALACKDWVSGKEITVSAGAMTHAERLIFFQNPSLIVGKVIKYKSFGHGVKDLPRFPTYVSLRAEEDMSE